MPPRRSGVAFLVLAAVTGCGGTTPSVEPPPDALADAAPELRDTGARTIDACRTFDGRCEGEAADDPTCGACQYRVWHRADGCSAARPCAELLLYWAAIDCDHPRLTETMTALVDAHPDLVVACAQPVLPGEILPTTIGAPQRDDAVVQAIFGALRPGGELGVWSGEDLLMAGCSMGATRYPVVAARYPDDASWLGTRTTAACFSDGVVDIAAQDRFVGEGTGPSCAARHRRIASGYTVAAPVEGHACSASPAGQCACDPAHTTRADLGRCDGGDCVAFDSIVRTTAEGVTLAPGVTADDLAIRHWKLVTEGGAAAPDLARRCEVDVVADPPFAGLCGRLDEAPGHDCVHEDVPQAAHCAHFNASLGTTCLAWFRGRRR